MLYNDYKCSKGGNGLFTEERHKTILEMVNSKGSVSVKELTTTLNFSPATIRSDLNYLSQQNLLIRTHGGATAVESTPQRIPIEENFLKRKNKNQAEKLEIAQKAMSYIRNDSSILLDASSTTFELATLLNESSMRLMILTNGLNIANLLKTNQNITTILIGGIVKGTSNAVEGTLGASVLERINIDAAFLSSHAFNLVDGMTDFSLYEVELKRKMVERAKHVYAIIDYTKLEKSSIASFASTSEIDTFITNVDKIDDELKQKYLDRGLNLV